MRAVVQRVSEATVVVAGRLVAAVGHGFLVLVGVGKDDTETDANYISAKITELRIFEDEARKMNRSVKDTGGSVLVVSQFTLYGDCRKGRRPSFDQAMHPEAARRLIEHLCRSLRERGLRVETGQFGAEMKVSATNHGPVTILLDSQKVF
ncbi:MAG: D-tyrosyl-tRNA(Tyr) deacylase [Candidatus Methylomirabilis oxyfera]|nr:D-tyrosyl-tRNA(Tyr) deacylase [Candidatus Methylomirabilis oxyfera]